MKGGRVFSAVACLMLAWPVSTAWAGTIYRCDAPDGSRSYVTKRIPGAQCAVASRFTRASAARSAPITAPPAAAPAPVAAGSASPANVVAGSPASINNNPPSTFMGTHAAAAPARSAPLSGSTIVAPTPGLPPDLGRANTRKLQQGQVYSYIKDGVRHYSSVRPKGGGVDALRTIHYSFIETCYACAVQPGVNFGSVRLNTNAYADEIAEAARQFGVEEAIVRAIMHAESAYNPNALSHAGAQGLMQLMPATAKRFGVTNAFDPGQNIRGGVQYLAWLLKRFNGDLTLAAAGYNAGEGAVDRHKGVPPYSETQRYVQRVGTLVERYRGNVATN